MTNPAALSACANKWIILLCYCIATLSSNFATTGFFSIAKSTAAWYDVSFNSVNQLAFIGFLCPFLSMIPAMWLADTNYFEVPFYAVLLSSILFRGILSLFPGPGRKHFLILVIIQILQALVSPMLTCLAPVLSRHFFPSSQRALATSIGSISNVIGLGIGLTVAPVYADDIPSLYNLELILTVIPLPISIFCLDLVICFIRGEAGTDTTYRRFVRRLSSSLGISSPDRKEVSAAPLPFFPSSLAIPVFLGKEIVEISEQDSDFDYENLENPLYLQQMDLNASYLNGIKKILSNTVFLRLLVASGLMTGVVNAWITLVSEAAPPSVDSPRGAQLICGLFFGFGTFGAIASGIASDYVKSYMLISRICIILALIPSYTAMIGWHNDNEHLIYIGIALNGLFGMPLYPLSIEYGIALTSGSQNGNVGATVSGVINLVSNVFGIGIILLSTPGNIPGLPITSIPLIWAFLNTIGGILFFTLPEL